MSLTTRAWVIVASVGAVEALKDQRFCRWNFVIRSLHQQAKKNMSSYLQAKRIPTSTDSLASSLVIQRRAGDDKSKQLEESLRKVIKMSLTTRAWIVTASVGAVEALKDQGFCRWNYVIRSLPQQAKKNMGSYQQAKRIPISIDSSASSLVIQRRAGDDKSRQSEVSLRKVMYLSCWGPN
ncbi:2-nonaprenyl-3-methyl-6-methoxy-1,4-benzoquinol hydroxylase [Cinnamomum micranthum f. kanehirae]|uniref:2-nonaprenyl-3-methyl-6-methoxy-1,4-benzoquinol hydroxylase n=1 Tax=Cinnamomum micranthum f. kanehirae TaxID=337451 RepID=A0A3S3N9L2_9MAGN|nr:2-nonaprenyl-3-methyl-6-methoxy-1,4-benzoquinol hydroxylase [Cinnamomum micranthum f. kanehirae]